jgi:hypothetical protein
MFNSSIDGLDGSHEEIGWYRLQLKLKKYHILPVDVLNL